MGAVAVLAGEVRAEGVGKTIDETTLLLPTDVSADPGECIVLRGPNGSGKTTLLRIIGGLLAPSTGTATIGGREADERDRAVRAAVAALLGAPTTYRDLTLVDHLVLIDSTWGGEPATSDERSQALLDRLGIAHLDDRFPHELSSGQEQLFRLALTFSRPASVVLLDEPEQRLDTAKRQVVAALIGERTQTGATVVMACHDPELTAALATRVVDVVPAR
ncbi:ABC transporter ATP-binding protein [Terrabacter carboxydivorans]|uniref:ABC transporter ATP-binding protein n=1 Tax=Terrabacter carboxydivorans TaxID=619730 RepID=A0ABN3M8U1_9MICO